MKVIECFLVRFNLQKSPLICMKVNNLSTTKLLSQYKIIYLCVISFKFTILRPIHGSYHNVLNFLNLSLLNDMRSYLLSKFFHNLIIDLTDCSELLSHIRSKISSINTWDSKPFYQIYSSINYIRNCFNNFWTTMGNKFIIWFVIALYIFRIVIGLFVRFFEINE